MEKEVGYCYPSGLEKTLCKFDIYVPLVTKGLRVKTCEEIFLAHAFQFIIHKSSFSSTLQGINVTINIIKFIKKQNNALIQ
jgi:hypothetical protein